jgi:hypothetical protein
VMFTLNSGQDFVNTFCISNKQIFPSVWSG